MEHRFSSTSRILGAISINSVILLELHLYQERKKQLVNNGKFEMLKTTKNLSSTEKLKFLI